MGLEICLTSSVGDFGDMVILPTFRGSGLLVGYSIGYYEAAVKK